MDIEQAADALWAGIRRGEHMPDAWRGRLSMADAYRVNLAILRRRVADGDPQAGWKSPSPASASCSRAGTGRAARASRSTTWSRRASSTSCARRSARRCAARA